jgi:uncharacterized membrane protein HdeD (DUF308 family)
MLRPSVSRRRPPPLGPLDDEFSALMARDWWVVGLRGALAIAFGLAALLTPGIALLSLVVVFGAYMLVDGITAWVAAARAARRHRRWGALAASGLLSLACAAVALLMPGLTALSFVLLIAVWSIISGVLALAAAFRLRRDHGRPWLALGGVASILFGALLFAAPLAGALVLTWWIGAYAIVSGGLLLALALRLRSHRDDDRGPALAAGA